MRLAIISDTPLPRGSRQLPAACLERLGAADLIVHAGDWSTGSVLASIRREFAEVVGVHGNADDAEVRGVLPDRLELDVGHGLQMGVVHDAGPANGRLVRLRARFPGAAAVVFGHSHLPLHEVDPESGFAIFNPGSPTDKRRQPTFTMGWAETDAAGIRFSLIDLGPTLG